MNADERGCFMMVLLQFFGIFRWNFIL